MTADILREKFLDFFKGKKHKIVESDSLVPKDDPTVLFTPAGMNQFKKEFLGFDSGFRRAATAQRCLRTDDLDKVGKTTGHHTFFEMLGNFSFGDYFKSEAISWAWEFLSQELKISEEKLWVSVYKDDDEAYGIWRNNIGVSPNKIIKLGDKENFWPSEAKEKGPNGPCGPCSEIFFDHGEGVGCKRADCTPACSCGRFVEVWNLVFTQFNRKEGAILEPLPTRNIDTGMGLERLTAVTQGVLSNFETELFQPIIKEILSFLKSHASGEKELEYALADHIRAIVFSIYDGVLPSNEARGYVVRKLIRKSVLHLRALGIKQPFLNKLVPVLAEIMENPYPELKKRRENIAEIILAEEESFINTLNSSHRLFKEKFKPVLKKQGPEVAGKIAFQLYDTYGIPLELSQDWLEKNNVNFSREAFDVQLKQQKARSKSQSAMKGDVFSVKDSGFGLKETKFNGYKNDSVRAKIIKIIKDNAEIKKMVQGEEVKIILDQTVFYPESGGQIGDTGQFIKGKNVFEVLDTQRSGGVIVHIGKIKEGSFKKGDFVLARIDLERRISITRNHTATHLLQAALRKVLGTHVQQQGSLVAQDRLRFDFTHFKDIPDPQLDRVEEIVNNYILTSYNLSTQQMSLSEARKKGALAFFGEKYGSRVRVVSIGDVSQELCGGTHLDSTAQIGLFKIIQEGSVASGIRRIEAVTGSAAYKLIREEEGILHGAAKALGVAEEKVTQEAQKMLAYIKELEKRLHSYIEGALKASVENYIKTGEDINGIKFIAPVEPDVDSVRKIVDLIKEKVNRNTIIASSTGSSLENKVFWAIGVTQDLCEKGVDAVKLIKEVSPEIGGSGGGRKDFAQAGGSKSGNQERILNKLRTVISNITL
jgi:alanyl-tRNA synthetase